MYSYEQRVNAVELLVQYDMSCSSVMRELGYPSSRESLRAWYREYLNKGILHEKYDKKDKYSKEDKKKAVNYYLEHGKCISRTCRNIGYPCRTLLKEWIEEIAPGQRKYCKKPSTTVNLTSEEKKQAVIDLCSRTGSADDITKKYGVSRCSLYGWKKDRASFTESGGCYGYRRIYLSVTKSDGSRVSEKVIRYLMKDENLVVKIKKRRKYNSYKGEITPAVENVIERDFHADAPNTKWLTDITEFHIPAGKVYLSPIIDCFDGLPVSWTIGTSPDADLVNTMLDNAISTLNINEKPIVHSDSGCHYRWPGWIERMEKVGLTRSMSKKGCSPDNSACEGFFGRLKNEMFYNHTWEGVTIEEFIDILGTYIQWYSEKRIIVSLGGMSPMQYRRSLGLVA